MDLENIKLDDKLRFKNEMELNILARHIMQTKNIKDIKFDVATELILKSVIYFVVSVKQLEEMTLNQVIKELEESKNKSNDKCFVISVKQMPIDHPARLYWNEVSSLTRRRKRNVLRINYRKN